MENKVDIFAVTYKDFEETVTNPIYKIINVGDEEIHTSLNVLSDKVGDNINSLNPFFSELTGTYWVWKNWDLKDYVGICQYRRYFQFLDNIPNLDDVFKEYDIILPKPYLYKQNMATDYSLCHNVTDLMSIVNIIHNYFPQYKDAALQFCQCNRFYPCNMFIMKREDFKEYCELIFGVMSIYLKEKNLVTIDDIKKYVADNWKYYEKSFSPNNELWYQLRIGGFLAERLLNIFVIHKFSKIKEEEWIMTHKKYNKFS